RPQPAASLQVLPRRTPRPAPPRAPPKPAAASRPPAMPAPTAAQLSLFADMEPAIVESRTDNSEEGRSAPPRARAVHRVLEWAGQPGPAAPLADLAAAAAHEFGVAAEE